MVKEGTGCVHVDLLWFNGFRVAGKNGLQHELRGALVNGPVAGPAFRGMHAGRAAHFARTGFNGPQGRLYQLVRFFESLSRQSCTTGHAVVDEYRSPFYLLMDGRGDAAEVVAVGHDQQRQHADGCVFKSVDAAHEVHEFLFAAAADLVRNLKPDGLRSRKPAAAGPAA